MSARASGRRGAGGRGQGFLVLRKELGQTEIEDLQFLFIGQHRVGGLDVAMQYALAVRRGEPAREPGRDAPQAVGGDRGFERGEAYALDVLHGDVGPATGAVDAVDGDDVGVGDAGIRPRLLQEARIPFRRGRHEGGDELDRDRALEGDVPRQPHLAHGSAAEELHQAVVVEFPGWFPSGRGHRTPRSGSMPLAGSARYRGQGRD